jgi:hypothetical protein
MFPEVIHTLSTDDGPEILTKSQDPGLKTGMARLFNNRLKHTLPRPTFDVIHMIPRWVAISGD